MKKLSLIPFVALALAGCSEYTNQMCTPANRVDVKGLEGVFQMTMAQPDKGNVETHPSEFKRTDVGTYTMATDDKDQGKQETPLYTCSFGNMLIAEQPNQGKSTYSAYSLQVNDGYMDMVLTDFVADELTKANVPFQLMDREPGKVLVVDNSKVEPAMLASLIRPSSLVIRLYRQK